MPRHQSSPAIHHEPFDPIKKLLPIEPGGIKILQEMHEAINEEIHCHPLHYYKISISKKWGIGVKFRDWLFSNYSAEVVQVNGCTMIRFIDEQQMLMFMLKYGA